MGMEDETREFLVKIVQTISIVMLWMLVNVFIGIYKGLGFFDKAPGWKNYLFYAFFIGSGIALVVHLKRKWKM